MSGSQDNDRTAPWAVAMTVAALLLGVALAAWRLSAPDPRRRDAPADVFSAARARSHLKAVLGDSPEPHPVGTEAHERVKRRLLARLESLGYAPEQRRTASCSFRGLCAELTNVWATRSGRGTDHVLLVAHYDSVAAGPGVADDGAGVAALLEIARVLRDAPEPGHPVTFLFTDGEEAGLLGAKAFVRENALSDRIRAVVNLEARGTAGPSLMFHSAGPSGPVASLLGSLDRPVSSSLFDAVYRRLRNRTDLTMFRAHGARGLDFAFIGGAARYHTPEDDLEHLSDASLQHHGDNALAAARSLADRESVTWSADGEVVWFDLLSLGVIRWPVDWSLPLAIVGLVLVSLQLAIAWRREADFFARLMRAVGVVLATMLLAGALGYGTYAANGTRFPVYVPNGGEPLFGMIAVAVGATSVASAFSLWVLREPTSDAVACAGWAVWGIFTLLVAERLPAASPLLLAPLLLAAVTGLVALRFARGDLRALALRLLPVLLAAVMWGWSVLVLVHAVGLIAVIASGLASGLLLSVACPGLARLAAVPRRRVIVAAGGLVALAAFAAGLLWPPFTRESPQRLSIAYYRTAAGGAQWWVDASWGPVPEGLREAGDLGDTGRSPLWRIGLFRAAVGPAPRAELAPPRVEVLDTGPERTRIRLSSRRGARIAMLLIPPDLDVGGVAVHGRPVPDHRLVESPTFPGFRVAGSLTTPHDGLIIDLAAAPDAIDEILAADITSGLPGAAEPLVQARNLRGLPFGPGDFTMVAAPLSPE